MFCFCPRLFWPKRKRSALAKKSLYQFKMFCFDLYVFVLTRNVPLCIRHFLDQIKLFCFVPESLGQYRNDLLLIILFLTESKCFASIYKFFYYIGRFRFASDNFWTKSNWFASSQNLWAKTVTNCF